MLSVDDVVKALQGVLLPAGGGLADSGRLSDILIDDHRIAFSISVSAEEAHLMEDVRLQAEAKVKALAQHHHVYVSLVGEKARKAGPGGGSQIRYIIAVASGKGGVGKSTTACNLALALGRLGLKVGVLDADIYGPSIPKLFGLQGKPQVVEGKIFVPLQAFGIQVMSIGFLIDGETPMIWRAPMVLSALRQLLNDVAWGELDVLVIDMPPGTGDIHLSLAQQARLAGAVIVSTPQDLALIDARRGIGMFRKVEVPVLGIVENMAHFCCPQCGHISYIFDHGGGRREAERQNVPFLGEVPLDLGIRLASDEGNPILIRQPDSYQSQVYIEIAGAVWQQISHAGKPLPRIIVEE